MNQISKQPEVMFRIYFYQQNNNLLTPTLNFFKPHSQMQTPPQTFQISQISQFRSILRQISSDNERSIREWLLPLLEDGDHLIKKTASLCIDQLAKKQQQLANVVEFALHVLDELEVGNQELIKTKDRMKGLERDFDKLLGQNEELTRKLQEMEDENDQFKNKILQAETYLTQSSLPLPNEPKTQDELNLHPIQISTFSKKLSHLTERPSPLHHHNNLISIQQYDSKINLYEQRLQGKSQKIEGLQKHIKVLKDRINALENELSAKSSELQFSGMYFREKLDILAQNQSLNKSQEISISQIQLHQVFKRDLLRVNSSKSILSIAQSSHSSNSDHSHLSRPFSPQQPTTQKRNNHVRRSLMYDFAPDFNFQPSQHSLYSSIIDSPDSSIMRERKKSISVSTADMRKTATKGVQTAFDPVTRIVKRTSNPYDYKPKQKKDPHQTSFLGLGSLTSMFSKKNIPKQKTICQAIQSQTQPKSDYSILGDSSLGDIFKGILDYATKKIVTDRVHKKNNKTNLNQSFMEQLNRTVPKRKNYVKGMKN